MKCKEKAHLCMFTAIPLYKIHEFSSQELSTQYKEKQNHSMTLMYLYA